MFKNLIHRRISEPKKEREKKNKENRTEMNFMGGMALDYYGPVLI
jgi:hypothetical protein